MAKHYKEGTLILKQAKEDKSGKTVSFGHVVENAQVEALEQTREMVSTFYNDPFNDTKLIQTYTLD